MLRHTVAKKDRYIDTQTLKQTEKRKIVHYHTDTQTQRYIDTHTDKYIDRHIPREIGKERNKNTKVLKQTG